MNKPIVVYLGPSCLDASPIVVLATLKSTNSKTGPMVQTWIMRADIPPLEASKTKQDESVCGQCPRRHSLGGDCYVTLVQAPRAVWDHWNRASKPAVNWHSDSRFKSAVQAHGLRLGAYGDPAAVPHTIWQELMEQGPKMHTGYTHQWATVQGPHADWLRQNVMASCDSVAEHTQARALGWRTFLAIRPGITPPKDTILCLAERGERFERQCEECGICNGTQGKPTRISVFLVEHGARSKAKHAKGLVVL